MKGNSFLNAFKVLRNKPVVFLLLFPLHAFAPMLLLALPSLNGMDDNTIAMIFLTALMGLLLLTVFYMIARSVFLISPAMELLHDGAAGQATPTGWFLRGLKKHWWKRASLGAMEYTLSFILSFIGQIVLFIPMFLIMIPIDSASFGNEGAMITMILVTYGLMFLISFVQMLAQFCIESLSAFLLAAFADRGFGSAFKAVFGKPGRWKFFKLLGGRFLITLISAIMVAFMAFAGVLVSMVAQSEISLDDMWIVHDARVPDNTDMHSDNTVIYDSDNTFENITLKDVLPLSLISTACFLLYSVAEIYRFAYEFCVFQELKNEKPAPPDPSPPQHAVT